MLDKAEYRAFKAQFLRRLAIGLFFTAVAMIAIIATYIQIEGIKMSAHGWVAFCIGIVLSLGLGGALTAVMVLGRRAGGDEAAGKIDWE